MRFSKAFIPTQKEIPADATIPSHQLMLRAGLMRQLTAGVYVYLPLGYKAMLKAMEVVREEMNAIGGQEIYMPALTPKSVWETTGRWDKIDVLFKLIGRDKKDYALGSTHEEIVTPLVKQYVNSYKDLPLAVYQIQDKFRDEPRAKSGLLRGREFSMKDLYSFHLDEADFESYYAKAREAYLKIFSRCGLDAIVVEASGGDFSRFSHEFQVVTPFGEDTIFTCECGFAQNKEIVEVGEGDKCPACEKGKIKKERSIEVGNIFPLKTRFTDAFDFKVMGADGKMKDILMGCYGIGPSRVMGSIVEIHNDKDGIIWPKEVAPFDIHLVEISGKNEGIRDAALSLYDELVHNGIEVLYDDRDVRPGEKFADADLIGIPLRLVVSERSMGEGGVEWKLRNEKDNRIVKMDEIHDVMEEYVKK